MVYVLRADDLQASITYYCRLNTKIGPIMKTLYASDNNQTGKLVFMQKILNNSFLLANSWIHLSQNVYIQKLINHNLLQRKKSFLNVLSALKPYGWCLYFVSKYLCYFMQHTTSLRAHFMCRVCIRDAHLKIIKCARCLNF